MRLLNGAAAELEAYEQTMSADERVIVIGEGLFDPKCSFGTAKDLHKKFPGRAFDSPISENGVTGICLGMAIAGLKPVLSHMRCDFMLYAMDQMVNAVAKWESMFDGNAGRSDVVMKAFIGRGFGSGNQHAQQLTPMFAHVPGLQVVCPSTAYNSKGLLVAAIQSDTPTVYLGHRWLHHMESAVPERMYSVPIGQARIALSGEHVSIVTYGYMVTEAIKAAALLKQVDITAEIVDLQTIKPMDYNTIIKSLEKTKNLFVVEDAWAFGGVAAEIMAWACEAQVDLDRWPRRQTCPNAAVPSSYALTKKYYPTAYTIAREVAQMFDKVEPLEWILAEAKEPEHDKPNKDFRGPF